MPPTSPVCPSCGARVMIPPDAEPGADLSCPTCGKVFSAAESEYDAPGGVEGLSRDYTLDLGRIFNRGWGGYKQNLGVLVGATVVLALISIPVVGIVMALNLIPIIGSLLGIFVNAALLPFWYGLVVVALAVLRGRPATFNDAFGGLRFFGPLYVYGVIVGLISWVFTLPGNICLFAAGANQIGPLLQGQPPQPTDPGLHILGQLLNFAGLIAVALVSSRYLVLGPYLIIDRKLGAIDAIKANSRLAKGHMWGWFGVSLLFGLIGGVGFLACCVGIFFTVPLYFCLMTAAYLEATSGSTRFP